MWTYPETYDVIVIGGGHAGCEAAHASSKMGLRTLLLTMNLDTIAKPSCNPAVGGTAKGHIVREIDALGGVMGKIADQSAIQMRMLNRSKGPAVQSPRVQIDRSLYPLLMKEKLEKTDNLFLKQGTTEALFIQQEKVCGVDTIEGIRYLGTTVVLASGTFMRGTIHIGETRYSGGRAGDKASKGLSAHLEQLGFSLDRLKTGTPPRVHMRSIDTSKMEKQEGDPDVSFSFDPPEKEKLPQICCYIAYTNDKTKKLIEENLHRSPIYSGVIQSLGPRYCPSIEDKIVRFADKERHQLFLEPEGLNTQEVYVNGISSSLPFDVQYEMLRTIEGMEHAEILRPAYAIEYDYVTAGQLYSSLETKKIKNLFFAGQINGTTGYEEAAAQGLIAGINAALRCQNKEPFTLLRSEAYIGVLIDELITKEHKEPYRMFTSRAEHRLLLRQDNADLRLRPYGFSLGLISQEQYNRVQKKKEILATEEKRLNATFKQIGSKRSSLAQYLARPEITYQNALETFPDHYSDHGEENNRLIELACKYAGYIRRQEIEVEKLSEIEKISLPKELNYSLIKGLRKEAQEKLSRHTPETLGQASRIAGVTPADISILRVATKK